MGCLRTIRSPLVRRCWWAAIVALASLGARGAVAESATPGAKLQFSDDVAVAWVLVPVVVRGRHGFLTRLDRDDFTLFVDDRPIAFDSFDQAHDGPVSLIHLQDLSGSMANGAKLDAGRRAFRHFLDDARPGDEFALATFASGRTLVDVPFTSNIDVHREALALWRAYGSTALHDAVAWLPEIGLEGRNVRRAALLVTDGADNASALPAAKAREMVRQARLPVYVLALGDDDPRQPRVPADADRNEQMLRILAHRTGGRYFAAARSVDEACQGISDEIRHQYVLGFRIRTTGQPDASTYRSIRVDVRHKKALDITFRRGYTGGPPLASGP